jgi:hypothetical protein
MATPLAALDARIKTRQEIRGQMCWKLKQPYHKISFSSSNFQAAFAKEATKQANYT